MAKSKSPWLADPVSGATGDSYEIRTVADFFKVPESRRRICLREFHTWMAIQEPITTMLTSGPDGVDPKHLRWDRDVYVWHDDGKAQIAVEMRTTESASSPNAEAGSPDQATSVGAHNSSSTEDA